MTDNPEDKIVQLMREIEELRLLLSGRTVSCDYCNQAAKDRDHLVKQVQAWKSNCRELMAKLEQARKR